MNAARMTSVIKRSYSSSTCRQPVLLSDSEYSSRILPSFRSQPGDAAAPRSFASSEKLLKEFFPSGLRQRVPAPLLALGRFRSHRKMGFRLSMLLPWLLLALAFVQVQAKDSWTSANSTALPRQAVSVVGYAARVIHERSADRLLSRTRTTGSTKPVQAYTPQAVISVQPAGTASSNHLILARRSSGT